MMNRKSSWKLVALILLSMFGLSDAFGKAIWPPGTWGIYPSSKEKREQQKAVKEVESAAAQLGNKEDEKAIQRYAAAISKWRKTVEASEKRAVDTARAELRVEVARLDEIKRKGNAAVGESRALKEREVKELESKVADAQKRYDSAVKKYDQSVGDSMLAMERAVAAQRAFEAQADKDRKAAARLASGASQAREELEPVAQVVEFLEGPEGEGRKLPDDRELRKLLEDRKKKAAKLRADIASSETWAEKASKAAEKAEDSAESMSDRWWSAAGKLAKDTGGTVVERGKLKLEQIGLQGQIAKTKEQREAEVAKLEEKMAQDEEAQLKAVNDKSRGAAIASRTAAVGKVLADNESYYEVDYDAVKLTADEKMKLLDAEMEKSERAFKEAGIYTSLILSDARSAARDFGLREDEIASLSRALSRDAEKGESKAGKTILGQALLKEVDARFKQFCEAGQQNACAAIQAAQLGDVLKALNGAKKGGAAVTTGDEKGGDAGKTTTKKKKGSTGRARRAI